MAFISSFVMTVIFCCSGCPFENDSGSDMTEILNAYDWQSYVGDGVGIWVSVRGEALLLIKGGQIIQWYPCSTAKAGVGNQQDSGQTPLGWHRIGAKIGDGLPVGAILEGRQWSGKVWTPGQTTPEDLILSRVLWLRGLEPGKNSGGTVDSWNRYIYIHGTNDTASLGRPASAGCVRLDPQAVIDLYDRVKEGYCVLITEE